MGKLATLGICLMLLTGSVSAEERGASPYVPYRLNLVEYNALIKREGRSTVYVAQSTPAPRSILKAGDPLELTLTFNHSIDPDSIPPRNTDWRLETPWGEVNPSNVNDFGRFKYSSLPQNEEGISYPPNTLRFVFFDAKLEPDTPLQCSLILGAPPRDHLGRRAADFDPEQLAYRSWNFLSERERAVPTGGGQYLQWDRDGLSDLLTSLLRVHKDVEGETVRLTLEASGTPFKLPHVERRLMMTIPKKAWLEKEKTTISTEAVQFQLIEMLYPDHLRQQGTQYEPTEVRTWKAAEGTVQLSRWTSEGYLVEVDLKLAPTEEEGAEATAALKGFFHLPPSLQD